MARKTEAQATDKWKRNTAAAGQYYQQGIQNATGWADKATQASNRRNAGLQQAIANGTIDAGIRRTGDQGWKNKTLAKGPQAWQAGVAAGAGAYAQGIAKAMQDQSAADQAVAGMDTSTVEGRVAMAAARALAAHRSAQQRKQSGG